MARRTALDPRATARVRRLRAEPGDFTGARRALGADVSDAANQVAEGDLFDSGEWVVHEVGPGGRWAGDIEAGGGAADELEADELELGQTPGGLAARLTDRLTSAERRQARRPFGRPQLAVVCCLVVLALLLAGWAVLRARPVALAEPVHAAGPGMSATPAGSPSTAASASPSGSPGSTGSGASSPAAQSGANTPAAEPSSTAPASPAASGSTGAAGQILIHVLGAVQRPGLVRLPTGARVGDALRSVGGLSRDANPGRLNLAQPLADGQQVFVAGRGHGGSGIRDPTTPGSTATEGGSGSAGSSSSNSSGSASPGSASAGSGSSAGRQTKININQADAAQLDELPGVGPVTASKIIAWRAQHGKFSRVEELQEVDGIGPKTYADLAPQVTV